MSDAAADTTQWVLRALIALLFVGMGVNHFRPGPARVMAKLIPPALRGTGLLSPIRLVYATGLCEIAGGIGILLPATRTAAMIGLVLFLIAVFPANAYAAGKREQFGAIAIPFWPRYSAQLALILVVVLAGI
ncbi:MAG: DoxX family membrane protein [Burkholderiaceae bacterium]|nr:DoxX family membrane protein [Microbacteriaceae bacterium]